MFKVATGLNFIVDEDGAVILNSGRNQITTLDAMGGYIWRRLEDGMTSRELVLHLSRETGEDICVVERDVQEFLDDLQARDLITSLAQLQRAPELL